MKTLESRSMSVGIALAALVEEAKKAWPEPVYKYYALAQTHERRRGKRWLFSAIVGGGSGAVEVSKEEYDTNITYSNYLSAMEDRARDTPNKWTRYVRCLVSDGWQQHLIAIVRDACDDSERAAGVALKPRERDGARSTTKKLTD